VLTIQGALPSAGGGGVTDHGALTGLGDDDHPQYETSAEAQAKVDTHAGLADPHTVYGALAQAETWAALQTFSAGLQLGVTQTIKDSGGTSRIRLTAAGPAHITHIGDTRHDGKVSAAPTGLDPIAGSALTVGKPAASIAASNTGYYIAYETNSLTLNTGATLYGLFAAPVILFPGGSSGQIVRALSFIPFVGALAAAAPTISEITGVYTGLNFAALFVVPTVTAWHGILVDALQATGTANITTSAGIRIKDQSHVTYVAPTNVYGILIDHIAAGTNKRLIEASGATGPNLRLEAGDPSSPGASKGRSQLLLDFNENGTITLRRVEWIDSGAAGGAGIPANAKVLVAV